jgi:hypothetical protein
MTASVPGAAGYKSVDEDGTDMDGETLTRIGAACLLLGLGWFLVGGGLALFGTVPALWLGYGVASAFTVGTIALAAGSPPGDTLREAALGAGVALAGVAWLLVGAGAYHLAGALLPVAVGAALLICGTAVFAYYDPDERAVDDWERDRPER